MKDFLERWRYCIGRVREREVSPVPVPYGFTNRVLANLRAGQAPSADEIWSRYGIRAIAGVSLCLLVCLALDWSSSPPGTLLMPHLEDNVARVFWVL